MDGRLQDELYLQNILTAGKYIDSHLFRPPYGRITRFQVKLLTGIRNSPVNNNFSIIMWDVLSGEFDVTISGEACSLNVIKQAQPGSVIVFHDSEKAFLRLKEALPKTLQYFSEQGYRFEAIVAVINAGKCSGKSRTFRQYVLKKSLGLGRHPGPFLIRTL